MDTSQLLTLIQQATKPIADQMQNLAEEQRAIRITQLDQDKRMASIAADLHMSAKLHERVEELERWRHARDLREANLVGRASIIIAILTAASSVAGVIAWAVLKKWLEIG